MTRTSARAIAAAIALVLASASAGAGTLVVAGTGASQRMLRELAIEFEAVHSGCVIEVPDSVGSRGGVRALLAGKADLARVSRPLRPRERAAGLRYVAFARTQVVFVVHPSVSGVERLTLEQLLGIYSGRIDSWKAVGGPEHAIFPLTRDGGTTLNAVLEHVPRFERMPAAAKATYSSLETKRLMLEHEFTLGFLPRPLTVETPLRIVSVLAGGAAVEIPLELGIVYKPNSNGCTQAFLAFLASPTARDAIVGNGATPTTP